MFPPNHTHHLSKGKGLMDTYWVKSKKTGDAASQTMLNPFQRQKISDKSALKALKRPTSPSPPRPSTPPLLPPSMVTGMANSYLSPKTERRVMSPKPDEWPIADLRLSHLEERRRGEGDRRYTMPSIQCQPIVIQRQLAGPGGGGGLPLANTASLLDRRNTITTIDAQEIQQAVIHSHPPGRPSVSSANPVPTWNIAPPSSPRDSVVSETPRLAFPSEPSEFNLMHIRDSLTQQTPLMEVGGVNHSQLSLFATMAEETARQARKVADWAAYIARSKSTSSRNASSDQLSNSEHGSPVDALLEEGKVCPFALERSRRRKEEREGSDTVFEGINGVCPVKHEARDESDQSKQDTNHHDNVHSNCSIM